MTTPSDRVTQLEQEVAELRLMLGERSPGRRPRSRMRRTLLVIGTALALVVPAGAVFAVTQTFSDVPPSHPFFKDVEAIAAVGVTTGCGGGKYCPDDEVTRGQMAAFLNRLGALGSDKTPVANAKTSQSTDGWSLGCPANTILSQGLCFDNATRGTAASIYAASDACATLQTGILDSFTRRWSWRLATANELLSAARIAGLNVSAAEWSSDMWIDSDDGWNGLQVFKVGSSFLSARVTGATSGAYRCATPAMSRDPISLILKGDEGGEGLSTPKTPKGDAAADTKAQEKALER